MSRIPLLRLLAYAKPYRMQVGSAIANSILNTIFDLAPPYLIGIAIDVVVNEENSLIARLGITNITGQLALLSLLTLLVWNPSRNTSTADCGATLHKPFSMNCE